MLMIRHSIGSRLLCQTDHYDIQQKGDYWEISLSIDEETASNVLVFQDELNIFDVQDKQKTWYYSSDSTINLQPKENQLVIVADHKTVYPAE